MRCLLWRFGMMLVAIVAWVGSSDAGDLTLRFLYEGEPPQPKLIEVKRDVAFCGQHDLVDESLLVHPETGGIKNVIVYVYTGRGGSDIDPVPPPGQTRTLNQKDCRYEPHILVLQAGDTLQITNSDPVGHNPNVSMLRNPPSGLLIPPSQSPRMKLDKAEPAPLPVVCNIHPWMKAYVVVLEHPYAGVSDEQGRLVIKNLPEEELVFRVFVEAAKRSLDTVNVNGQPQQWTRNRFRYDIQPGNNDMGTVLLNAEHFRPRDEQ
ncbi:cupredoxin domain-containing protein [Roseimaritima sediminicola]|uniref:methylamine utilization protein n=1 Tax=Roseimaritima sediminicola TaxID=2662066 RepID=UPI001F1CCA74|nr:methylamine utilization protein [Roseimaritima sediminicola]